MLPRELQTSINHLSPESRRVAGAIMIFYEDYYGGKLMQLEARLKELKDRLAQNSRNIYMLSGIYLRVEHLRCSWWVVNSCERNANNSA